MESLLYGELASWYYLVDPTADHADEAESYRLALEQGASPPVETLLELGAGGGNNAYFLKRRFRCTLSDVSEPMLNLSRALNPECEHVLGDMRSLRLGRTFDAVLVHDAVVYMTSEADLAAAAATAFAHTRPGGAAIFAPDDLQETFREATETFENEQGARALRGLEWSWDPDPNDTTYRTEYVLVLREGTDVRVVHDRHVQGVFPRATWYRLLEGAGYQVSLAERALGEGKTDRIFLCRRP